MNREEQIKQAARSKHNAICQEYEIPGVQDMFNDYFAMCFGLGAKWADAHPLDNNQHHPQWISVEDELPPKNKAYIAYWEHLGHGRYRFIKRNEKVSRIFEEHVTHWMPLPPPPKKGGQR